MTDDTSSNEYSEQRLAEEIGVSRESLRKARETLLKDGEDYHRNGGGSIKLTQKAANFLLKVLGIKKGRVVPKMSSEEKASTQGPEGAVDFDKAVEARTEAARVAELVEKPPLMLQDGVRKLIVWRKTRNRRIINASLAGEVVRVEAKDCKNFQVGMEIDCVHVEQDLWTFVGKPPRPKRAARFQAHEEGGDK